MVARGFNLVDRAQSPAGAIDCGLLGGGAQAVVTYTAPVSRTTPWAASLPAIPIYRVERRGALLLPVVDHVRLSGPPGIIQKISASLTPGPGPVGVRNAELGDTLTFEIAPVEDPEHVAVIGPHGGPETWRCDEVADRILGVITRVRLDDISEPVRLHAGAVAEPTGRAVILLGASGAGKSTLTAHLVARGLELINDEQVAVHPSPVGMASGFTRPIAIKRRGSRHLPTTVERLDDDDVSTVLYTASSLGGRHRLMGVPALVVALERTDQACDSLVIGLSPSEAMEAFVKHNLDLVRDIDRGLGALSWLASEVPAVRLEYHSAADAAKEVERLLHDPPKRQAVLISVNTADSALIEDTTPDRRPRWLAAIAGHLKRSTGVETVSVGMEAVLIHVPTLRMLRLNAAGAAFWNALPIRRPSSDARPFAQLLNDHEFVTWEQPLWSRHGIERARIGLRQRLRPPQWLLDRLAAERPRRQTWEDE